MHRSPLGSLIPLRGSRRIAKALANETGKPVTVRNVVTDKVIATEVPDRPKGGRA